MQRSILAIFAALALTVSLPVAAQFEEQDPQQQQLQEEQQAPGQAQSLTGTVIEWDEQQMTLTLRTDQGIQEVRVEQQGVVPQDLSQGDQVTIQAEQSPQGDLVAASVETEGAQEQFGQQQEQEFQEQELQQEEQLGQEQELQQEQEQLPATGSGLPLVGLLGLLSVAAAFGVRFLLR